MLSEGVVMSVEGEAQRRQAIAIIAHFQQWGRGRVDMNLAL